MVLETLSLSGYMGKSRGALLPQCLRLQPARSLRRAGRVLRTDLCPKAKVRKCSSPRKGVMKEVGETGLEKRKGTGRKGKGISRGERG